MELIEFHLISSDKQKESHQMIQSLKQELQSLKSKLIDPSRYTEWDTLDIITWILSLENGRYNKYKSKLEISLNEENVKGTHLAKVNVLDIKGWGIVDFSDKKSLMVAINALVNQNEHADIQVVANVEGAQCGQYM